MFTVLSRGKWAGCTSFFSWLRSILLKYCLFWAQTLNTSVSDGLCKQINKQANIDRSFVYSWAICASSLCQTSRAIFISVFFLCLFQSKCLVDQQKPKFCHRTMLVFIILANDLILTLKMLFTVLRV